MRSSERGDGFCNGLLQSYPFARRFAAVFLHCHLTFPVVEPHRSSLLRHAIGVALALALAGCASMSPAPTPAPAPVRRDAEPPPPGVNLSGFPLPYRQGYADGCASAGAREVKDATRYASDGNYRTGWTDGRAICGKK